MNAVLSGRAGIAVIRDGQGCSRLDHGVGTWVECPAEEGAWQLFGECRDFEFLEQIDRDATHARLKDAVQEADALDLALTLLDTFAYAEDTLKTATEELEEHLTPTVRIALERIFCACPLPQAVNVDRDFTIVQSHPKTKALFAALFDLQPAIPVVQEAWLSVPTSTFAEPSDREVFRHFLMKAGVFRDSVLAQHDTKAVSEIIMLATALEPIKKLTNHRAVMTQWAKAFNVAVPTIRSEKKIKPKTSEKRKDRQGHDRNAAYSNARKQVDYIAKQIRAGHIDLARKLVGELIESELKHPDGYKFAAKSLSDLANIARDSDRLAFQLELSQRATELHHDDVYVWTHYARALQDLGKYTEALAANDQALKVDPHEVVAKCGRADVLKALGRFDESLQAYEKTLRDHPENVFSKNGRADVLKRLGRLVEALQAYELTRIQHPDNTVAKTSMANVLLCMGRSAEALELLPEQNLLDSRDWIGLHIRGMALLRLRQLPEALAIFERGLNHHLLPKTRTYFQSALAIAKVRMRAYQEAVDDLDQSPALPQFIGLFQALRVHAYGRLENAQKAAECFAVLPASRLDVERKLFRTLQERFITHTFPSDSDDDLIDLEIEYALQAA